MKPDRPIRFGRNAPAQCAAVLLVLGLVGCARNGVESTYGRTRGDSVNGTGAFAELLREEGHTVRTSVRLKEDVGEWAETIVRFAPYPGPMDKDEADWYWQWLNDYPGRQLIYVVQDFDAEPEYWTAILDRLPADAPEDLKERIQDQRNKARLRVTELPPDVKDPADSYLWFDVQPGTGGDVTCQKLGGPWAEGIDPAKAGVSRRRPLKVNQEEVLLAGDGKPLVIDWSWEGGGQTLVMANGSFLLNEPLAHPERRLLADRVVEWIGDRPRNVVFIETRSPEEYPMTGSVLAIFGVAPLGFVLAHWLGFLLILSLSAAAILGRPREEPATGAERPVAHAEALGDLLRRTGDAGSARGLLDAYTRWRFPSGASARRRGRLM